MGPPLRFRACLLQAGHACPIQNRVTYSCEQPSPQILKVNPWHLPQEGDAEVRNGLRGRKWQMHVLYSRDVFLSILVVIV